MLEVDRDILIKQSITLIKTHGSESRGKEAQSARPQNNKHATTTVSHLHEGSIMQPLKSAWRNLSLTQKIPPRNQGHVTFV